MTTLIDRELVLEHLGALLLNIQEEYDALELTEEQSASAQTYLRRFRDIIEGKDRASCSIPKIEGIDTEDIEDPLCGMLQTIEDLAGSRDTLTRFSVFHLTTPAWRKIDATDKDDLRQYAALTEDALTALLSA
jgi:hypothetical protein